MDDAATEDALEKVVQLFAFITDKDLFGEIYRCANRAPCVSAPWLLNSIDPCPHTETICRSVC